MEAYKAALLPDAYGSLDYSYFMDELIDATAALEVYVEKINFSKVDSNWILPIIQNKEALKERVKKMVGDMPMEQKEAWQCIPNTGYDLMYTFVGKQSSDIVSVVLTVDDLQGLLY